MLSQGDKERKERRNDDEKLIKQNLECF